MSSALVARFVAKATLEPGARTPLEPFALPGPQQLETWRGESQGYTARLSPLQSVPALQAADAQRFRELGLGDGEPFRLELNLAGSEGDASEAGWLLEELNILDAGGVACSPVREGLLPAPWAARFATPRTALASDQTLSVWLWGRSPSDGARLEIQRVGQESLRLPLTAEFVPAGDLSARSRLRSSSR